MVGYAARGLEFIGRRVVYLFRGNKLQYVPDRRREGRRPGAPVLVAGEKLLVGLHESGAGGTVGHHREIPENGLKLLVTQDVAPREFAGVLQAAVVVRHQAAALVLYKDAFARVAPQDAHRGQGHVGEHVVGAASREVSPVHRQLALRAQRRVAAQQFRGEAQRGSVHRAFRVRQARHAQQVVKAQPGRQAGEAGLLGQVGEFEPETEEPGRVQQRLDRRAREEIVAVAR